MPLQVKDAIGTDTGERINIIRKGSGGSYIDGIWVSAPPVIIKALASVQQPTKKQLELFTGLERTKDMRTFYVNKKIICSSEFDTTESDVILWDGKKYRTMQLGGWESYGFNLVLGVRIE